MKSTTFWYGCPACGHEFEIDCTFGEPPSGYLENYDPGSGDEFSRENCPRCDAPLDRGTLSECAANQAKSDRDDALEERAERAREQYD